MKQILFILFLFIAACNNNSTQNQDMLTKKSSDESVVKDEAAAMLQVKALPKVKDAIISIASVLYVTVDDSTPQKEFAESVCRLLSKYETSVERIKEVQFGTSTDPKRENAYGIILADVWCK